MARERERERNRDSLSLSLSLSLCGERHGGHMVCLLDLIKKLCCFVFLAPTQMLYGFVETRWLGWQFLNGV